VNSRKKIYSILFFFFISVFATQEKSSAKDLNEFLENIKMILQKIFEVNKQKRMSPEEKLKRKREERKKIIEKLSNPYKRLSPHNKIIKIGKPKSTDDEKSSLNTAESNNEHFSYISQTILKLIQKSPPLNPLDYRKILDSLRKLLQTKDGKTPSSHGSIFSNIVGNEQSYINELRQWYLELIKNVLNFWLFFKKVFVEDENRYGYLEKNLCKNEIKETTSQEVRYGIFNSWFNTEAEISEISVALDYWEVGAPLGFTESNYYFIQKYIKKDGQQHIPFNLNKSLCYNLTALNHLGLKIFAKEKNSLYDVYRCITSSNHTQSSKECENISKKLEVLERHIKRYLTKMSIIAYNKLFPSIITMCIHKCVPCEGIGLKCMNQNKTISSENLQETILQLLYTSIYRPIIQQKSEPFIRSIIDPPIEIKNSCKTDQRYQEISSSLSKLINEFISLLEKEMPRNLSFSEQATIEKVINQVRRGELVPSLDTLSSLSTPIFGKILTSEHFANLLTFAADKVKEFTQLKENNVCSFYILSFLASSVKNLEIFALLSRHDFESRVLFNYGISENYLPNRASEYDKAIQANSTPNLLKQILLIPYDIYYSAISHKVKKCFNISNEGLYFQYAKECITDKEFDLECYFEKLKTSLFFPFSGQQLFTEVVEIIKQTLKSKDATVFNLEEKLMEITNLPQLPKGISAAYDTYLCDSENIKKCNDSIQRENVAPNIVTKLCDVCPKVSGNNEKTIELALTYVENSVRPDKSFLECNCPLANPGCTNAAEKQTKPLICKLQNSYFRNTACTIDLKCRCVDPEILNSWKNKGYQDILAWIEKMKSCCDSFKGISLQQQQAILSNGIKICSLFTFNNPNLIENILEDLYKNIPKEYLDIIKEKVKRALELYNTKDTCPF
jgi:hypothetical protein